LSELSRSDEASLLNARIWYHKHIASLEKLERRARRGSYEPRRVFRPNLEELKQLRKEIAGLPKRRRIRAEQARRLLKFMDQHARRQRRIDTLVTQALHRHDQILYRLRLGGLVWKKLETPNGLDRLLQWLILDRTNARGENVYAVALALKRKLMLPPGQLAEWGRKGARARWAKREPASIGDEPTSRRGASSLNEAPVSDAHE
jgi:hypothetical protein